MASNQLLNLRDRKLYPKGGTTYKQQLSQEELYLLDCYLQYRAITFNPLKIYEVQRAVMNFRHVTGKPITSEFTLDDVQHFLRVLYSSLWADESKKATGEYLFTGGRAFLKWRFKDWGVRFHDFLDESGRRLVHWRTKPLSDRLTESELITEDDIIQMLRVCPSPRDQALIALHGSTPARTKEIRDLRWQDVLFEQNRIRVHDTKTGRTREMPFDERAAQMLRLWHQEYFVVDYPGWRQWDFKQGAPDADWLVFPARKDPRRTLSPTAVLHLFKRAARKAGINKHIYGYLNRHSVISRYQKQGVDIRDVANIAGHRSINTTLGYTHLNASHSIQQVVSKVFHAGQSPQQPQSSQPQQVTSESLTAALQIITAMLSQGQQVTSPLPREVPKHDDMSKEKTIGPRRIQRSS
ncbi:MAG: tyrosine-type recombinase/integrase [Phycisphaeraceae bacterium]|nr:tyrosine-type recombinase/integrase [Phycisphaeraceae bacterium]